MVRTLATGFGVQWPRRCIQSHRSPARQTTGPQPGPPCPPAAPSSVSKKGRRKWAEMGASKTNRRPSAPTTQAPGAQCPAALTLAQRTLDSLPGRPRETHRAGVAESRPPATAPGHLASLLSLSPRTSRHKEAPPGQVLSAGDHGQEALCLRAWELQGDGGALCPHPLWPSPLGPEEGLRLQPGPNEL